MRILAIISVIIVSVLISIILLSYFFRITKFFSNSLASYFPSLNNNYTVAKSIPKDPGATYWIIDDIAFGMDVKPHATIDYKTNTPSDKLVSFYESELTRRGWIIDKKELEEDGAFNYYIYIFKKNIGGKDYLISTMVNANHFKGLEDNYFIIYQNEDYDSF